LTAPLETNVWIAINGVRRITLACSPHELEALVVGHLFAEGWIEAMDDVHAITVAAGPGAAAGVEVTIAAERAGAALLQREHRTTHGCGLRHVIDCEAARAAPRTVPDLAAAVLFRDLFAAADRASPTGGVHAAALSDGGGLLHVATDVARHSAVDRAIGKAVQSGADLSRLGLVLTARVSGAIAMKCAHAGVAWTASRSIATSLAREIADATGVVILERAAQRERHANLPASKPAPGS
jgi:FdhD protein